MCGIVGVAATSRIEERGWLTAGRDAMTHRGPDDAGEWWSDDGRVGLGHRRLSIIDLSQAGHQPMADSRVGCHIVFNGEIYNFIGLRQSLSQKGHTFVSGTDTEVIIAAYKEWGTECLSRLNGMFSFAIFDAARERLFLARDRAGEKPLYYAAANGALRFSSELKGLMADPAFERSIDTDALDCYLAMGFVPGAHCILKGVRKLPPAHALLFDLRRGDSKTWCYWSLDDYRPSGAAVSDDGDQLIEKLETILHGAVRKQLVADVPVGVLLSGGVDSSLITALAAQARQSIKTFTVRFPGHAEFDETAHARLIASHFGTEHVELEATESAVELLPVLARQYDEPMADSSMVPTFVISKLVREHCTVALGGDGGDELFGGYAKYNRYQTMRQRAALIPRFLRAAAARTVETFLPVGFRGRNLVQQFACDFRQNLPFDGAHFDPTARSALARHIADYRTIAENIWAERTPFETDVIQRATRMDFANYLPEKILVKVDRASMANSLEIRAPFLDQSMIEFAFGEIPAHLKVTQGSRKILLKRLAQKVLPPEFDIGRKQGFSIPLASWLKTGPWLDYFSAVLTDTSATTFDNDAVRQLLEGQSKGHSNSERLFSLVMFELWRKEYQI
jgi:asparagine synthase (glutamine-hydrolysing)